MPELIVERQKGIFGKKSDRRKVERILWGMLSRVSVEGIKEINGGRASFCRPMDPGEKCPPVKMALWGLSAAVKPHLISTDNLLAFARELYGNNVEEWEGLADSYQTDIAFDVSKCPCLGAAGFKVFHLANGSTGERTEHVEWDPWGEPWGTS